MDFDQMLETWRAQDATPTYRVNHDALRRSLQTEEAEVQRVRRRDMWVACIAGGGTTIFGACWLWALIYQSDTPIIYTIVAALGFGMVGVWLTAYCVSRWRQAKNERDFGNTLHEEVRRTLSRVEIDIWRFRSWPAGALQIAPIMIGALLINWSVGRSQNDGTEISFMGWWMYLMPVLVTVYLVSVGRRLVKRKLEPRRKRLRELLAALEDHAP
jgi:hypothetical protein